MTDAPARPLTADEFMAWAESPERGDRLYELIDGEIIEKMASFIPSRVALRLGRRIDEHAEKINSGYTTGADGSYRLSESVVLIPDVGYISKERMPDVPSREVPVAPDLAVEVMSPNDSKRGLRRKAELYMSHGTRMVWLVFPEAEAGAVVVEVYTPDADVIELRRSDTLSGGDLLPGFTLAVETLLESA